MEMNRLIMNLNLKLWKRAMISFKHAEGMINLTSKCIYFNFCFLFFLPSFQFTGFTILPTWPRSFVNSVTLKHVGPLVTLRQESAIILWIIWWCLRHFPSRLWDPLWAWGNGKSWLFVSGFLLVCRVRSSERRAWGLKMPKLEEREEVGYPHEPTLPQQTA